MQMTKSGPDKMEVYNTSQKRKPALPRFYQLMMYSAHEACYSSSYIRNIRTRNTNCTNTISFLFTPFQAGRGHVLVQTKQLIFLNDNVVMKIVLRMTKGDLDKT